MPADAPTILATSGGIQPGRRVQYEFSALTDYAVDLSGVTGRAPRVCMVPTAQGDNSAALRNLYDAAQVSGFAASHLALFPMPNVDDIEALLLDQDVVWVLGGSVAGLLAMWHLQRCRCRGACSVAGRCSPDGRIGGIDLLARGRHHRLVRAGPSTCHQRTRPRPLLERCAYDSEPQRRPFFQRL